MSMQEIINWNNNDFSYPIPKEYLDFLEKGDFSSTERLYYIIDDDAIEISEWFTCDTIPEIYKNCCEEGIFEKCYLPIFDSCACTVAINCDSNMDTYGQVYLRSPEGYFDEATQKNVYEELEFVAKSFTDIINNLHSEEELEEMGL